MKHPFYPSSFVVSQAHRTAAITGLIAFIVGACAGWFLYAYLHKAPATEALDGEVMTGTTTAIGAVERGLHVYEGTLESIRVASQKAGREVFVAAVALSKPSWVAVREEIDGEPGKILGAQLFDAGEHAGTVDLLRATKPGSRYHAYLFQDDGDLKFDWHKDAPITKNGLLILTPFTTY